MRTHGIEVNNTTLVCYSDWGLLEENRIAREVVDAAPQAAPANRTSDLRIRL